MFALTKRTDYAIIALTHMAQRPGEVTSAREIAERFHVPPALLVNVLKTLTHRALIRSTRGVKGGYSLAQEPEEITLEDIITAVEGPVRFVQCSGEARRGQGSCELLPTCPLSRPAGRVHARLIEFLRRVTLADMVEEEEQPDRVPIFAGTGAVIEKETHTS